jgi:hypothetical protein
MKPETRKWRKWFAGRALLAVLCCILLLPTSLMYGGGPLLVGGPSFGTAGVPIVWDTSATKPIPYRIDAGPLSQKPSGGAIVVTNATGISRVQSMFGNWQAVPTADLSFSNAGAILPVGTFAGGDVKTVDDFLAVAGDFSGQTAPDPASCAGGGQNPVIFDADGSIFAALGLPPEVIGFEFPCQQNASTGKITAAGAILNGEFQDGINDQVSNLEISSAYFDQAFTHEFGHFLGLDHSQINVNILLRDIQQNALTPCTTDENAGMPLMFPVLGLCPARTTAGLPMLAVDDAAWISKLYPVTGTPAAGKKTFASAYGIISGTVYFSDGVTPAQGVNVIARSTTLPTRNAVSVVSGFLFTGNPGQTVTCQDPANPTPQTCSNLGSDLGSRDATKIGYFEIPVPPGTYTLSVESVYEGFQGGSGVGPLSPPIPMPGTAAQSAQMSVVAGGNAVQDIVLQGTQPRFDAFESAANSQPSPLIAWLRHEWTILWSRLG